MRISIFVKNVEILSKLYHSSKVHRTAGGSTLNAVRMSNFLLKSKVAYIGCVGKDLNGEFIKKVLKEEKINFGFVESEANATSTAIVLIDDNDRDLYVNVGASSDLSLEKIKEFDSLFNNAKIIMKYAKDKTKFSYTSLPLLKMLLVSGEWTQISN